MPSPVRTLIELVSECSDVRLLLGRLLDPVSFWIASRRVCKTPLVGLDQQAFDRLLWGTLHPAEAFRTARLLGHPHLHTRNPILAAGPSGWASREDCEAYCARALQRGSLQLLAWSRANGCAWSAEVRDAVTELRVPAGTSGVCNAAFNRCRRLHSLTIPDGIAALGDVMLSHCVALHTVVLPSSITKLGNSTFAGCGALTDIPLPPNLRRIGRAAFMQCSSLRSIELHPSVRALGDEAFEGCTALGAVTLSPFLTQIGSRTFCGCRALAQVRVPPRVHSIGISAFEGCVGLTRVALPLEKLVSLGSRAFAGCTNLISSGGGSARRPRFRLPDGITALRAGTFQDCRALREVVLPARLRTIDHTVFDGCTGLRVLWAPRRVPVELLTNIGDALPPDAVIAFDSRDWM